MKIKRAGELLWVFGIVFVALGVALCSKANLGVSMIAAPVFVVQEAVGHLSGFLTVGAVEYIIQGILLILMCFLVRRFRIRYLFAFLAAVIYGYTVDLFLWMLGGVELQSTLSRWVFLLLGDVITAFGVACFFRTNLPLQVYELFVKELADNFSLKVNRVKLCFDLSLLVLSVVLALCLFGDFADFPLEQFYKSSFHSIGLGTIITTVINSPIIALFGKLVDKCFDPTPRFERIDAFFKKI